MAFTVVSSIVTPGDRIYYESSFRNHLESHINLLKVLSPAVNTVPPDALHQFEGNLYGYLSSIGQPTQYHWVIMRMNGYHNPHEFGREIPEIASPVEGLELVFPNPDLLARIRSLYLNIKK